MNNSYAAADAMRGRLGIDDMASGSYVADDFNADVETKPEVISEYELLHEEPVVKPISPYDKPGKWFVIHTQSGYEKRVKSNIEARVETMNMENRIHEVVIPSHDVPEFKNGKKVISSKFLFPGYVFVRCDLDDEVWPVVRDTPNVSGFVTQSGRPTPLSRRDVERYIGTDAETGSDALKRVKPIFEHAVGDTVQVKDGPFADFSGEIMEINEDQLKVKVLVNIFGRETPTEVGFAHVARL